MSNVRNPDLIGKWSLTIAFSFSGIMCFCMAALTWLYIQSTDSKVRESLTFFTAVMSATVGATNTFYVLKSIQENSIHQQESKNLEENQRKIDRALMYISRWNSPEYTLSKAVTIQLQKAASENGSTVLDLLTKDKEAESHLVNILNFLEEIAFCIKSDLLDEDFIFGFYRYIVINYREKFSVYIEHRRTDSTSPRLYIELTQLSDAWRNKIG